MYYLYVKIHNITGMKYLGYTSRDPHKYLGSGRHWNSHIKIHGKDIITEILGNYPDQKTLKEAGLFYSNLWDVVRSESWANEVPESGVGIIHTEEIRQKLRRPKKNKENYKHPKSIEHRIAIGNANRGKTKPS